MSDKRKALADQIRALVSEYFAQAQPKAVGAPRLPLHVPSYGPTRSTRRSPRC